MVQFLYRMTDWLRRRSYAGNHGRIGEDFAHRFLRRRGCTIVARNYRARSGPGEIDLVVWHGETLAFVEVKTRSSEEHGSPATAVDADKRRALQYTAREYSRRSGIEWERTRFDIVSVVLEKRVRIEWEQDAFR
jgi:putative endonuclease